MIHQNMNYLGKIGILDIMNLFVVNDFHINKKKGVWMWIIRLSVSF